MLATPRVVSIASTYSSIILLYELVCILCIDVCTLEIVCNLVLVGSMHNMHSTRVCILPLLSYSYTYSSAS